MNVRNNPFFKKAQERAKVLVKNPNKVKDLLDKALKKSNVIDSTKDKVVELKNNVTTLIEMLRAHFTGKYKAIPANTLLKLLAAVIYFIWFADLIPDFLAVIGLVDDAAVIAWVITSIKEDLDAFLSWKNNQNQSTNSIELQE